jgi:hypothetical protein
MASECGGGKLPWNIFVNMCQPVQTQGPMTSSCVGAAICQQWSGASASLGQFAQVSYQDIAGGVLVTGLGGTMDDGTSRAFQLSIVCSTNADPYPTFVSEDPSSLTYKLTWNRPEACGSGCGATQSPGAPTPSGQTNGPAVPSTGLSTGWYVFIFLWVFVAVYFIGGAIFMATVKGARGVEVVPNLTFWTELPALIKDGFRFVGGKMTRKSTYGAV